MKNTCRFYFLLIVAFLCVSSSTYAGNWIWAKSIGSSNADQSISRVVPDNGNNYVAGFFSGTIDVDPGSGVVNFTSPNGQGDIFLLKLDSTGTLIWARQISGNGTEVALAIDVDETANAVYITGNYSGTVDFDPGVNVASMTAVGSRDMFIVKTDTGGNFQFAKSAGGVGIDQGLSIAIEKQGGSHVYVSGTFTGTADLDPGMNSDFYSASGTTDIFLLKMNDQGDLDWIRTFGGDGSNEEGMLSTMADNDPMLGVVITGFFSDTIDFDGGGNLPANVAAAKDVYLARVDSAGDVSWVSQLSGAGNDQGNGLAQDAFGTIYLCGYFSQVLDADPGIATYNLTAVGGTDIFVARFSSFGTLFNAIGAGGSSNDFASAVTVNPMNGDAFVAAGFQNTIDLDPGAAISSVTSSGGLDILLWHLDNSLNYVSSETAGGSNSEYGTSIFVESNGAVQMTGIFNSSTLTIDNTVLTNQGSATNDIFLSRWDPTLNPTGISSVKIEPLALYPNPAIDQINLSTDQFTQDATVRILDMTGRVVLFLPISQNTMSISLAGISAGVYTLQVSDKVHSYSGRFTCIR